LTTLPLRRALISAFGSFFGTDGNLYPGEDGKNRGAVRRTNAMNSRNTLAQVAAQAVEVVF
jgi:hypothetical protein